MSTTIHDVAKKLNLSITTISRALDGYEDVSDKTRQRVIQTASEMGYAPNRAARQLRRQKTETMGFIIPSISKRFNEPFFTEFIAGLGEELSRKNFDLLISNATTDEDEHKLYHRWTSSHKVDGFILNRMRRHDWRVNYLTELGIPFVGLGKSRDGIDYPCMRVDAANQYLDLVQHIQKNGFSNFAFIGGPNDLNDHIARLRWFKAALMRCGLEFHQEYVVSTDMTSAGGYKAAQQLLTSEKPPNALLCVNDQTAYGVLHAVHEHSLEVGKDIAVSGFDGLRESDYTEPALTTLAIPVAEIAQELVRMLLKVINNETLDELEIVVKAELRIRASTGE